MNGNVGSVAVSGKEGVRHDEHVVDAQTQDEEGKHLDPEYYEGLKKWTISRT